MMRLFAPDVTPSVAGWRQHRPFHVGSVESNMRILAGELKDLLV
jgi:hypothetical protein